MRGLRIHFVLAALAFLSCGVTSIPLAAEERVTITTRAQKICQIVGETDRERGEPTLNLTGSRYKLYGTDLGVPFRHGDRIYLLFGDTIGPPTGDAIAYTTDFAPEDGLSLDFIQETNGVYRPVKVPGVNLGAFEVPMEGISLGGRMYVYVTTDYDSRRKIMGRSVLAVSDDDGRNFRKLYDLSRDRFINVSTVEAPIQTPTPWVTAVTGGTLAIFGSGKYRKSDVYLALQPARQIEDLRSIRYFAGFGPNGAPIFASDESKAQALFHQPCVGELSVSYNKFLHKWVMLYNAGSPLKMRGIDLRTADQPWGPWSEPQVIFEPWKDNGYGHYIHVSWRSQKIDQVHDPGRQNEWGGEYGPYQFEDLAIGEDGWTTIYFTMSVWNPYTVVLMKAGLGVGAR